MKSYRVEIFDNPKKNKTIGGYNIPDDILNQHLMIEMILIDINDKSEIWETVDDEGEELFSKCKKLK